MTFNSKYLSYKTWVQKPYKLTKAKVQKQNLKNISTYIYTTIPRSLTEVLKPYPHKSRVLKKK